MPNTWPDMTSEQQDAALAEKLGYKHVTLQPSIIDVAKLPKKDRAKWLTPGWQAPDGSLTESPPNYQTWHGVGLVVEAMAARGFDWSCNKGERTKAAFVNHDYANLITVSAYAETPPAATAEAAWKALGGE